jgi:hypothetical protein
MFRQPDIGPQSENDLWWSHISHIVPCAKSYMISHWSLVEDNTGQLWMNDFHCYAGQSYGSKDHSCLVVQKLSLTLESVPDIEEVSLDLSFAELNLPVVPGGEGINGVFEPVVKLQLVPVVDLAAVPEGEYCSRIEDLVATLADTPLEPVMSAAELSGTSLLGARRK